METGIRTFEERQIATFKHGQVERIVWQPRFSDWYHQNNIIRLRKGMVQGDSGQFRLKCPDLPENIFGMEQSEIYEYINASPRYPGECWPGMGFFFTKNNPDVEIKHVRKIDKQGNRFHKIITPHGTLTESWRAGSSYPDERILKTRDDFKAVLYYLEHMCAEYCFNENMYNIYKEINNGLCVSVGGPWRSPYNKCIVELAGTKATMLLMMRYRDEFDRFCEELSRINFEVIMPTLMESPIDFISLGDNVDSMNNPPPVYKRYLLPYFNRVAEETRKARKFSFAHYDGHLKDILPYLNEDAFPFDGIEAPTVLPQGDVSLDEFRRALGDEIIVLDGIVSTMFLPHYSDNQFRNRVIDVLDAFSPNLILGVSDEFPPNGLFSRLERVEKIVEDFKT